MNFSKLKQFVKQNGDKFILLDVAGEPEMVVLSFAEYDRMVKGNAAHTRVHMTSRTDGTGKEEVKSEPVLEETEFMPPSASSAADLPMRGTRALPVRLEDIRLEDLPL